MHEARRWFTSPAFVGAHGAGDGFDGGSPCGHPPYGLDLAPLFLANNPGGVFAALRNAERFGTVRGDYALIWPSPEVDGTDDGIIDIAPECVRFYCEREC